VKISGQSRAVVSVGVMPWLLQVAARRTSAIIPGRRTATEYIRV